MAHFETSAKDDSNVKEAFFSVIQFALNNYHEDEPYFPPNANLQARLATNAKNQQGGGCC